MRYAPGTPEYEDDVLLTRVDMRPAAYVARPAGKLAALRLKSRGLVEILNGSGRDEGLLIVRRTSRQPRDHWGLC